MTDQEIIDYIRLRLGGISQDELPDSVIFAFLTVQKVKYATNEPLLIYYTIIDCVNYLIAKASSEGDANRVMQQEGQVMVDITGIKSVSAWRGWLDYFTKTPDIEGLANSGVGSVIVGGVSKTEYNRVANDTNSVFGGYKVGSFFDERFR